MQPLSRTSQTSAPCSCQIRSTPSPPPCWTLLTASSHTASVRSSVRPGPSPASIAERITCWRTSRTLPRPNGSASAVTGGGLGQGGVEGLGAAPVADGAAAAGGTGARDQLRVVLRGEPDLGVAEVVDAVGAAQPQWCRPIERQVEHGLVQMALGALDGCWPGHRGSETPRTGRPCGCCSSMSCCHAGMMRAGLAPSRRMSTRVTSLTRDPRASRTWVSRGSGTATMTAWPRSSPCWRNGTVPSRKASSPR